MTDLYLKYEINEKVDIWMLGCILYTMCFYNPPFQESSKLAIVEASYIIPKDNRVFNFNKLVFKKNDRFNRNNALTKSKEQSINI